MASSNKFPIEDLYDGKIGNYLENNVDKRYLIFHIARNLNYNIVGYHLNFNNNNLDLDKPVFNLWHNLDENTQKRSGLIEKTNMIENSMAYGINFKKKNNGIFFNLNAKKDLWFELVQIENSYFAKSNYNGVDCLLLKLYINCTKQYLIYPKVNYILAWWKSLKDSKIYLQKIDI